MLKYQTIDGAIVGEEIGLFHVENILEKAWQEVPGEYRSMLGQFNSYSR